MEGLFVVALIVAAVWIFLNQRRLRVPPSDSPTPTQESKPPVPKPTVKEPTRPNPTPTQESKPPVPKPTVKEPTRPNPIPNDGISFDIPRERGAHPHMKLAAIIHGWFDFVFSSAEAEQEIRRLQQSGFTKGEALAKICTRGYEESFCPKVATNAHRYGCEHLFQGREREQFEMGAASFMSHTYTLDIGNEVGALLEKREDD